jgi:cell division protein FtsN
MSSIVPIISFMVGFYVANNTTHKEFNNADHAMISTSNKSENVTPAIHSKKDVEYVSKTMDDTLQKTAKNREPKQAAIIKRYIVQVGIFSVLENAKKLTSTLIQQKLDANIIDDHKNGTLRFRVIVGSHESQASAKSQLQHLEETHKIKLYLTTVHLNKMSNYVAVL